MKPDFVFGTAEESVAWRLPTDEGVTWRVAVQADLPRLHQLWDEMDRTLGGQQDRPRLLEMPVLLVMVAVDDTTGNITSAIYGECVVDWTMIGTDRRAARAIDKLFPLLAVFLFDRTIRVARVLVPRRIEKHMAKMLPQMRNITQSVAQFVFKVRD